MLSAKDFSPMLSPSPRQCYHALHGLPLPRQHPPASWRPPEPVEVSVSASVGTRGAWFTFGPKGTRTTVGIPGTGISYTTTSPSSHSQQEQQQDAVQSREAPSRCWSMAGALTILLVLLAIAGVIGWLIGVAMR